MISLDLTRVAPLVDRGRPHLVKGRAVSVCHHCKKSTLRASLLRCKECRHDFCPNCLDACGCYTETGFRVGDRRKPPVSRRLALITGTGPHPGPRR